MGCQSLNFKNLTSDSYSTLNFRAKKKTKYDIYAFSIFYFNKLNVAKLSSARATINNKPTPNEIMISYPRNSRAVKARNPWKQICSTVRGTGFYCTAYCTVIHCTIRMG